MADFDFEPPSFSLGFDLDTQPEPQSDSRPDPLVQPAKQPSIAADLFTIDEDVDGFKSPVGVPDSQVLDPPPAFKRLRRGPMARKTQSDWYSVDDDIEDFSSEEDCPRGVSVPTNSVCSSSKPSLHGQRALTSELGSQLKSNRRKDVPSGSASVNMERIGGSIIFPKLTVSPLRRFQLIDSDSEDSESEYTNKEVPHATFTSNKTSDGSKHAELTNLGTKKTLPDKSQTEDLWKDFRSEKSSHIPTPAFDEVCEEFFTSVKNKSAVKINQKDLNVNDGMDRDVASLPPSHFYFFHNDSRIQKLVRDRLPYFFPLGAGKNQEYTQENASVIDYMGQFGREDKSRQTGQKSNADKSSTRGKKNAKKLKVDDIVQNSENWVSPRSSAGLPKNAGNRRVQAAGKSAGHWYTSAEGQRVYVNKNGQELTGQMAYRLYKKESGKDFKRSKKPAAKKKSAPKKK